jgi:hypothetical protein
MNDRPKNQEFDRRVAKIAATQYGLIIHDQAIAVGGTEEQIDYRLATGRWLAEFPGVYRIAGVPSSWEQHMKAATLAGGPTTYASHRASMRIWGLDVIHVDEIEIVSTIKEQHRLPGVIAHRSTDLIDHDVTVRYGIPVTRPARMLVDLGAVLPERIVARVTDQAVGRKLVTITGVAEVHKRVAKRGRRGAGVIGRILEPRVGLIIPGVFEANVGSLLRAADIEMPVAQCWVIPGVDGICVDYAFPPIKLALEADGYEPHSSFKSFRGDRRRFRRLEKLGWTVLPYTWEDVMFSPASTAAEIIEFHRMLSARAA